jgi:hypothetical protein
MAIVAQSPKESNQNISGHQWTIGLDIILEF